ncbi:MAG: lipid-A-disaccharide synthase [Candidatus Hydrogenedentota bacterium]
MTRVYFVAGETSGDVHGSHLIRALREMEREIECEGLGGSHMRAAGMTLHYDLAGDAIMGFAEVVKHLGKIRRLFHATVERLRSNPPDCLVLIDYPGFNIRLAQRAKGLGIPVVWYISPQVWAWKRGRIHTLAQCVDQMLVILPFEEALYRDAGLACEYVGHPLVDHFAATDVERRYGDDMVIGILPGSRAQEIDRLLPVMLEAAAGIRNAHPNARFVTPCVDVAREAQVKSVAREFPLETLVGRPYDVLSAARFCLVASGTATVETMLHGVPMIILYKVASMTYWLARWLVRVDHIGMVNILAGKRIVPEFIQHDAAPAKVIPAALELIADSEARRRMIFELAEVREKVGGPGASRRAAESVLAVIRRRRCDG